MYVIIRGLLRTEKVFYVKKPLIGKMNSFYTLDLKSSRITEYYVVIKTLLF